MVKINLWLMGGFGNVLFQMFVYRILVAKGVKVKIIGTLLNENIFTRVGKIKIHEPIFKKYIKEEVFYGKIFPALLLFILKKLGIKSNKYVFFSNQQELNKLQKISDFFGYFQSKDLIESNKQVFENFCKDLSNNIEYIEHFDQVVHFRLGDRNTDSSWMKYSLQYYALVRAEILRRNKQTLIVTDSREIAAKFFEKCACVNFGASDDDHSHFIQIASATVIFCAPSTFSWWAAHLSSICEEVFMPDNLYQKLGFHKSGVYLKLL